MENKKWVMEQTWENRVHEWLMLTRKSVDNAR